MKIKITIISLFIVITQFPSCSETNKEQNKLFIPTIAIGDSWFDFPNFLEKNIAYQLSHGDYEVPTIPNLPGRTKIFYKVTNVAINGQSFAQMLDRNEWWKEIIELEPSIILISAGGNDILDTETIRNIVRTTYKIENCDTNRNCYNINGYVDEAVLQNRLTEIKNRLHKFISFLTIINAEIQKRIIEKNSYRPKSIPLVLHGYDYIIPREEINCSLIQKIFKGCQWVGPILSEKGILIDSNFNRQKFVTDYIITSYNAMLSSLVKENANSKNPYPIIYVNNLGIVGNQEFWVDEIHPNSKGFKKVANNFHKSISDYLFPQDPIFHTKSK